MNQVSANSSNDDFGARLRVGIAQINPVVGDIAGNCDMILDARATAAADGADIVLFSELVVSGYPPEDLVLKPAFMVRCRTVIDSLAAATADGGPGMAIGVPLAEDGKRYNAVAVLDRGRIVGIRHKVELPNYGPFDEKRVFTPGALPGPIDFRGVRLGIPICEDAWFEQVCECLMETGAELLLVPNGSPYWRDKAEVRMQVMVARVVETGLPAIYANQVGGQDELVFDGGSFGLNSDCTLAFQMPQFASQVVVTEWRREMGDGWRCADGPRTPLPDRDTATWSACVMGLRDYVTKNRFSGVILGLSGGIDSAVCAAIAVDALGADKVRGVMLPYRYTALESIEDAAAVADRLGIQYETLPIAPLIAGARQVLSDIFAGRPEDIAEENIQSRARGLLLMALSNKFGPMVVTTGNKSEMSVGYATLYGDMNGGFNPIKDLYKTEVYRLAAWRNRTRPPGVLGPDGAVVPERIIAKPPSAELRENQRDQDSLPAYDVLDDILECLIEAEMSVDDIEARGHDRVLIHRIENLLYAAEYKRRQAPPGVKLTRKNFGRDRRYPIVNRFRDRS